MGSQNEDKYLNPDFKQYNANIKNKLKVQRLVIEKHAKDRRATLMLLPFIKDKDPISF